MMVFPSQVFAVGQFTTLSSGSGTISAGASFVGGIAPDCTAGSADSVVIDGSFALTQNIDCILGTSPADDSGTINTATVALGCKTTGGTGQFIKAAGVSLTLRAGVRICNGAWTFNNGGTVSCQNLGTCDIIFDSHLAAVPATANYSVQTGQANCTSPCATVTLAGSSATPIKIGIAASSGKAGGFLCGTSLTTCNAIGGGQVRASWCKVDNVGLAGQFSFAARPENSGDDAHFDLCNFTNSARIGLYGEKNNTTFYVNNSKFESAVVGTGSPCIGCVIAINFGSTPTATPTGVRYEVVNNYFDASVRAVSSTTLAGGDTGFFIHDNVFAGNGGGTSGTDAPFVTGGSNFGVGANNHWYNNLLMNQGNSSVTSNLPAGTTYTTYSLMTSNSSNLHPIQLGTAGTHVIKHHVCEREFDDVSRGTSDCFQTQKSSTASVPITFVGNIVLLTPGGQTSGTIINHSSNTPNCDGAGVLCPQIDAHNNSGWGDDATASQPRGFGGEINTGFANLYAHIYNNLIGRSTSGAGSLVHYGNTVTPVNSTFNDVNYNGWWNFNPSTANDLYLNSATAQYATPAPPGPNDTNADPQYVDTGRNFLAWGKMCKASVSTYADVIAELKKLPNDSTANGCFKLSGLVNFARGGMRPRNSIYTSAGKAGTAMGADTWNFAYDLGNDTNTVFSAELISNGGN